MPFAERHTAQSFVSPRFSRYFETKGSSSIPPRLNQKKEHLRIIRSSALYHTVWPRTRLTCIYETNIETIFKTQPTKKQFIGRNVQNVMPDLIGHLTHFCWRRFLIIMYNSLGNYIRVDPKIGVIS